MKTHHAPPHRIKAGNFDNIRIVIAAGHNIVTPGARYNNLVEHEQAVKIVKPLEELLKLNGFDVLVVCGGLPQKIRAANHFIPRAAVEVHFNAAVKVVGGTEMLHGGTPDSIRLAMKIQEQMVRALGLKDRGIKLALNWNTPEADDICAWVRDVDCPAIIAEPLFLSNPDEAALLRRPKTQLAIAGAILRGIKAFFSIEPVKE